MLRAQVLKSILNMELKSTVNPGGKQNIDINQERQIASFKTEELTNILDGGCHVTEKRRKMRAILFKEPVFCGLIKHFESLSKRYEKGMEKATTFFKLAVENGWETEDMKMLLSCIQFDIPVTIHAIMFMPAIERMGTDSQKAKWLPSAMMLKIIGTYAQTEMGHGTNLKKLETSATYDLSSEEFILNTPLPGGMKFWPGGLGKTANHAVVMAELIIDRKRYGLQAFVVPLRRIDNHMPLPGIEVGDIGPRIGLHTADNGYLILRNVRIPRENLLMKYCKVTPDGRFIQHGTSDKVNYGTMMLVRSNLIMANYHQVSMGVTIATRYSAVRRQSELNPGEREPQILDYQTQQYKLFPNIALAYALWFSNDYMLKLYENIYETELKKNNFSSLPELHSQSAGLKALCSELTCDGLETCRRSCGGHGYLKVSGVADIYLNSLAGATYEGENTVMYLQTARYLMKSFAKAQSGERLAWSVQYLSDVPEIIHIANQEDLSKLHNLAMICKRRAYYMVERVARKLQSCIEGGQPHYLAWNDCSVQLINATKAHLDSFMCINFISSLDALTCSPDLHQVLRLLCQLYTIHRIVLSANEFLESGALMFEQIDFLRDFELQLMSKLRPEAVSLVDAFDWHDETLCSALGRYDGNVYEALYESTKLSTLNETQVHPAFEKFVKPFREMSKL